MSIEGSEPAKVDGTLQQQISDAPVVSDAAPLQLDRSSPPIAITVESRAHGWRLDHYLTRLFPNHSRAQLQRAIEGGHVLANGLKPKASRRLRVNDRIHMTLPDADDATIDPEDLPIDVLYEDDHLVIVNKAAGMIVHPGRGNTRGTLAAGLQYRFDQLSDTGGRHRPGIVHRLDRDTTGVLLVAKDNQVHQKVSKQFEQREVKKEYRAIVRGIPELVSDRLRTFMCVHTRVREKMMVCPESARSRHAETFYETAETFLGRFALINLHPHTGRTHQLRVHMQHIGTPIVADRLYTGRTELRLSQLRDVPPENDSPLISRQALHAFRLTIRHPVSGKEMQFEAPFPNDFQRTLDHLRQEEAGS
jgi:23S rRNA pseudouridine1911/1915/1917 synthase